MILLTCKLKWLKTPARANTVCRVGGLIQSSFEHVGSMKKSVKEACMMWTSWSGPMLTSKLKSTRYSSTSLVHKDKNFSIITRERPWCKRGWENKTTPRISRTCSISSTPANICVYNALSSANGRSFWGGRMPRMISKRWSRPRCPELVAGSRKQVEVVVMGLTMYRICLQWVTWSWGRSPYHNDQWVCAKWKWHNWLQ